MKRTVQATDAYPNASRDTIDLRWPHLGAGLDIATTTKKKSNPSAFALTQQCGHMYFVRVIVRLKTGNPDILKHIIESALSLPHGILLAVDASRADHVVHDAERYDIHADILGEANDDGVLHIEAPNLDNPIEWDTNELRKDWENSIPDAMKI